MMELGLYEQIINKVIFSKINELDKNKFFINESVIDKQEAARILSRYLSERIQFALGLFSGENNIEKQM